MKIFIVYEFIYSNIDECTIEEIIFIGAYRNELEAQKVANERVKIGVNESNMTIEPYITNKKNPFDECSSLDLYRKNDKSTPIYSINIKELKLI